MIDSSSRRSPSISAWQRMLIEVVLRRLRPAVGDDAELELAEGDGPATHGLVSATSGSSAVVPRIRSSDHAQQVVVALGREAEHVGDEQQRQRRGDVPHEVALAPLAARVSMIVVQMLRGCVASCSRTRGA